MRRRGGILMVIGLVLALGTGALVFYLLQQTIPDAAALAAAQASAAPEPVETTSIPVAGRELTVGETITTTDIIQREYPEDLVPVGVLTDTQAIAGQVAVERIQEGEFFRTSQFRAEDEKPLSEELPADKIAMAFSREDLLNKADVIHEGDHLDLMLTIEIEQETEEFTRKGKATSYTLQNIKVLRIVRPAVTTDNPNPEATAIIFELDPQDAVIAKFVKDAEGVLDFTLRSPENTKPHETAPINQDYMFDHYGFQPPVSSTKPKQ